MYTTDERRPEPVWPDGPAGQRDPLRGTMATVVATDRLACWRTHDRTTWTPA